MRAAPSRRLLPRSMVKRFDHNQQLTPSASIAKKLPAGVFFSPRSIPLNPIPSPSDFPLVRPFSPILVSLAPFPSHYDIASSLTFTALSPHVPITSDKIKKINVLSAGPFPFNCSRPYLFQISPENPPSNIHLFVVSSISHLFLFNFPIYSSNTGGHFGSFRHFVRQSRIK